SREGLAAAARLRAPARRVALPACANLAPEGGGAAQWTSHRFWSSSDGLARGRARNSCGPGPRNPESTPQGIRLTRHATPGLQCGGPHAAFFQSENHSVIEGYVARRCAPAKARGEPCGPGTVLHFVTDSGGSGYEERSGGPGTHFPESTRTAI